jgi:hypothetical protein
MPRLTFEQLTAIGNNRGTAVIYDVSNNNVRNVLWVNPIDSVIYTIEDQVTETAFLAVFTAAITKVERL